jgi:hypothetical protein
MLAHPTADVAFLVAERGIGVRRDDQVDVASIGIG